MFNNRIKKIQTSPPKVDPPQAENSKYKIFVFILNFYNWDFGVLILRFLFTMLLFRKNLIQFYLV